MKKLPKICRGCVHAHPIIVERIHPVYNFKASD